MTPTPQGNEEIANKLGADIWNHAISYGRENEPFDDYGNLKVGPITIELQEGKEAIKHALNTKDLEKAAAVNLLHELADGIIEIQEMFDGEADIDNRGGPNRAMQIDAICDKLTTKYNSFITSLARQPEKEK